MINALLIHANNLNPDLIDKFPGEKVVIDYSQSIQRSNFILDWFLHEELSKAFENKAYQVIFIPYTLSQQNYLELTGLRIAAHIRITDEFNHRYVPIVFVGPETPEQIAKLSDLGNILFTSGIFSTTNQEADYLKSFFGRIMKKKPKITESEYEKGIRRLQLSPPANYQSHHSIDNELALLRWSEYLKCDDRISDVKENLKAGLYFKYHKILNPVKQPDKKAPFLIFEKEEGKVKGKVLLIDDEAKKGWEDFYRCFFKHNIVNESIEFDALDLEFKSLSQQDIIEAAKKRVEQFDADIVLLDLRLCDSDFKDTQMEPKDLTGYKILEEIKKINKGIQVIITTASDKIWNYQSTHELGVCGYIIKRGNSDVAEDINNLKQNIEYCIKKAKYLKPTYLKTYKLNNYLDSISSEKFAIEIKNQLSLAYSLLNDAKTDTQYAYAYISLYMIVEIVNNEYYTKISDNKTIKWKISGSDNLLNWTWDKDSKKYTESDTEVISNKPPEWRKFAGIYFQKWNETDHSFIKNLYHLIQKRNGFVHGDKKILDKKDKNGKYLNHDIYTHEGYEKLFGCIEKIIGYL